MKPQTPPRINPPYDEKFRGVVTPAREPSQIARAPRFGPEDAHWDSDESGAIARDQFELVDDEPSWHRRSSDICPIKRARWEGVFVGIAVGIVLAMAAVAWRSFGALLP